MGDVANARGARAVGAVRVTTTPVLEGSVAVVDLVECFRVRYRLPPYAAAEFVEWFLEIGALEMVDGDRVVATDYGRRLASYAQQAASE